MSDLSLEDFAKLMPDQMKQALLDDPACDMMVARLRERPINSQADVDFHIEWYREQMRREDPVRGDPILRDPEHVTIKLIIMLAQEKMAIQDGAIHIPGNMVKH